MLHMSLTLTGPSKKLDEGRNFFAKLVVKRRGYARNVFLIVSTKQFMCGVHRADNFRDVLERFDDIPPVLFVVSSSLYNPCY